MAAKQKSKSKKLKKSIQTTDPAQYARFLEAAKKLEVDESGKAFERAIGAVIARGKKQL